MKRASAGVVCRRALRVEPLYRDSAHILQAWRCPTGAACEGWGGILVSGTTARIEDAVGSGMRRMVTEDASGGRTRRLTYSTDEGTFVGFLAEPAPGGPRPAVLVAHEGPGLDAHARHRTEKLAELGYIAFACDLHGSGHVAASHEETMELVTGLRNQPDRLRARIRAALDTLRDIDGVDRDRIAAIGYCFGGMAVLELARSGAPVVGTTTFHGLLSTSTPAQPGAIAGRILVFTGAADHLVPPEQIAAFEQEMDAVGVDWQIVRFGGVKHAFTNMIEAEKLAKLGFGYDALADRRSWAGMRRFLAEVFE